MSALATTPRVQQVVIVGTGFAGLGMAIRLKQAGIHDFTIFEKDDGIGGTWRANHYPGAACDVESNLYSFSFEPNPSWSRTFAPQKEILAYLEKCAEKYGLTPHIRCNTAIVKATWDERSATWTVETSKGEVLHTRAIVAGCGGLSRPQLPDIEGLEDFQGKTMHSARWDDAYSFEGKRAAVLGTGASAIQIIPQLAPVAKELTVFQRTAPWIMPKADRPFTEGERDRFTRFPISQKLSRAAIYTRNEIMASGFLGNATIMRLGEGMAKKYLARKVKDPSLREKLTPKFRLGCKRVLLTNDYYPAMTRPNVTLVTDPIARVEAKGVRTKDGVLHELDALVLATGFQAAEQLAPFETRGRDGLELNEAWKNGAEAYLGTTIAGFPNFFMIVGPNTGLGHTSMIYMIESQIAYILDSLQTMRKNAWAAIAVKKDAVDRYNAHLHGRFAGTVWSSGCASWYRTKSGKNTVLWPSYTFEYRWRTRKLDTAAYEIVPEADVHAPERAPSRADRDRREKYVPAYEQN